MHHILTLVQGLSHRLCKPTTNNLQISIWINSTQSKMFYFIHAVVRSSCFDQTFSATCPEVKESQTHSLSPMQEWVDRDSCCRATAHLFHANCYRSASNGFDQACWHGGVDISHSSRREFQICQNSKVAPNMLIDCCWLLFWKKTTGSVWEKVGLNQISSNSWGTQLAVQHFLVVKCKEKKNTNLKHKKTPKQNSESRSSSNKRGNVK